MATLSAQITADGISAPDYSDIVAQLKNMFQVIYGTDINLDDDAQDGQIIAVFARAIYDCNQTAISVYNSFSPATAQGNGLASVVKINGIRKNAASNSSAVVTLVGVAGTFIEGGQVGDNVGAGTKWNLPFNVTIPDTGTIDVTATCTVAGAILAAPNTLTEILTPTLGWQSASNLISAAPGAPVESDAALRSRQAKSTALPALTVLEGIYSAVASAALVQQLQVYENDADAADANGIPAHTIAVVALGGDAQEILQTIALKKSPGTGTAGTTSAVIIDSKGVPVTIRYYPMAEQAVYVKVTVQALAGYSVLIGDKIKQELVDWINGLAIGEDVFYGKLWGPANLFGDPDGETFNVTAIALGTAPNPIGVADIVIPFTARAFCTVDNINLIVA